VTSNWTAGQDREDGQKAAERKAAVAAVGDGAVSAKTSRLTTIPSHQRASDSHDYTRLATLKVLNGLPKKHTGRLKKQDAGMIAWNCSEADSLHRKTPFRASWRQHDDRLRTIVYEPIKPSNHFYKRFIRAFPKAWPEFRLMGTVVA